MGDRSRLCSVWLGSETGILKGVSLTRKQAFNFCDTRQLSRDQEVRVLSWGDPPAESELLLGLVDGTVRTFSTEKGAFTDARRCGDPQDGCFAGLAALSGSTLVSCTENGAVRVWAEDSREPVTKLEAGKTVCRMRQSPVNRNKVATGGKENGLKIWDLQRPEAALFSAKNLRDDWLALRRPHWVRDVAFIPDSDKVVTCTGYHQVHVFDPSTPQRRPVLEAEYGEYPLTALSLTAAGSTVVVGNTQGQIALGCPGGVRGLQCHPSQPVVASCGLDRFLRIHSLEDRRLLHKVYLKSRLNCLLLASRELEEGAGGQVEGQVEVKEEEEEEDEVWASLEQVEEETTKRKAAEKDEEMQKKKKKKGKD
uniref:WD repeat domain 74 n=1 Tax=Oryzias sinensis TaxID=183150 RepID=A0A8C7WVT9_9TELE